MTRAEFGPLTIPVSRADALAYALASGDHNPIHRDDAAARALGLPGVIIHGMWTMGAVAGAVAAALPGRRVVDLQCAFTKPVPLPETGATELVVAGEWISPEELKLEVHHGDVRVARMSVRVAEAPSAADDAGAEEGAPAPVRLSEHTTFRVGGPAREFVVAQTENELIDAVRTADAAGIPVLLIGGGSNLLIGDAGFDGRAIKVATEGISAEVSDCGGALVTAAAGMRWDAFVAHAVEQGWVGVETLSGIPGNVGSTPIQNVGAYGADVAQTIARVRVWDRAENAVRTFTGDQCEFGYRSSRFKADPDRWVVLQVVFHFKLGTLSAPIAYPELARALNVEPGERAPLADVRRAVLQIRGRKGMVLDPADHDTWSAGSFFTNPILSAEEAAALPDDAPRFAQPDGRVKTSAAWLIEHAGFGKGYGSGAATLSTKHTLALTNRGEATAADVQALAREIIAGVERAFGITLVPEPVMSPRWQG